MLLINVTDEAWSELMLGGGGGGGGGEGEGK